jgi:hydroxymethylbilane synthase
VRKLVAAVNHEATRAAVTAERAFLAGLEGGCAAPVAAYARLQGKGLLLRGLVASGDGKKVLRFEASGDPTAAESLGRELAARALAAGAAELMPG